MEDMILNEFPPSSEKGGKYFAASCFRSKIPRIIFRPCNSKTNQMHNTISIGVKVLRTSQLSLPEAPRSSIPRQIRTAFPRSDHPCAVGPCPILGHCRIKDLHLGMKKSYRQYSPLSHIGYGPPLCLARLAPGPSFLRRWGSCAMLCMQCFMCMAACETVQWDRVVRGRDEGAVEG